MIPKDVHVLITRTVNITFLGKMDLADMIKLRIWRCKRLSWLTQVAPNINLKGGRGRGRLG